MTNAFDRVHQLVQQGLQQQAYPSAALAVGVGETIFLKRTYGQCTESTIFDMASVSKVIGPTMVAFRFLEDGLIRLYDTVGFFFPEAPEDKKGITVLQLLTHTGGFKDSFHLADFTSDPADVLRVILEQPLVQAPGGDPIYSCMGYILWTGCLRNTCLNLWAWSTPATIPPVILPPRKWIPIPESCFRVWSMMKTHVL